LTPVELKRLSVVKLTVLNPYQPEQSFPPVQYALEEPNGLLAVGGCLSPTRIINAYKQGIFPWFNPDEPILWWSPNPRLILLPQNLYISRRLAKTIRSGKFNFTIDTAFAEVIDSCSQPRRYANGTWISDGIKQAYTELHRLGFAHSAETWLNGELVGGLYGVALGQVFFGESMFHKSTDASKVAFAQLVQRLQQWRYQLIDCQMYTEHLASLGAREINREDFTQQLNRYTPLSPSETAWQQEIS
jgi:leucyl/phenylalanyl-tRNA---protein transferase